MLIYTLDLCYYVFSGQHARLYIPTKPDKSAASATVRQLVMIKDMTSAKWTLKTVYAPQAVNHYTIACKPDYYGLSIDG